MFKRIEPTVKEINIELPGDELVPNAAVVMDRAMTLPAAPAKVWPWFVQLGKNRAGWYMPRSIEWMFVKGTRGIRHIDPNLQQLRAGDVIDDWGGKNATFRVSATEPEHFIVHESKRGHTKLSWAIKLSDSGKNQTRVHFRLRLNNVKFVWIARTLGNWFDGLTIKWLRQGLIERLER